MVNVFPAAVPDNDGPVGVIVLVISVDAAMLPIKVRNAVAPEVMLPTTMKFSAPVTLVVLGRLLKVNVKVAPIAGVLLDTKTSPAE